MKKIVIALVLLFMLSGVVSAQKYFTKSGRITFDATSPSSPEKIEGVSRTATCVLDVKTGLIQFSMLLKGFAFERALMEEHFNENYVESHKYPKAEFKGVIENNAAVVYTRDGTYPVRVKGVLSLHGETKEIVSEGQLTVKGDRIQAAADFGISLGDFRISIPGLVADKVSKSAKIAVACVLEPLKN